MERDYHFFTSSSLNWRTHASLKECMTRQEAVDLESSMIQPRGYTIYKVLLPADARYSINNYRPVVDESLLIRVDTVHYEQYTRSGKTKIRLARGDKA